MSFTALLAEQPQPPAKGSPLDRPEILWGSAGLVAALLVGAVVIYVVDKWRRRTAMNDPDGGAELSDYRAMLESGEISRAEYEKLRQKVAGRVKGAEAAPAVANTEEKPAAPPPVQGPFPPDYFEDPPKS
jgi:hypothetical protein